MQTNAYFTLNQKQLLETSNKRVEFPMSKTDKMVPKVVSLQIQIAYNSQKEIPQKYYSS